MREVDSMIMKKILLSLLLNLSVLVLPAQGILKSVIYDFDGLNTGANNLPDGDYRNNDLQYQVAPTPLGANDMLGDRSLQLNLTWASGSGEFGKDVARFIDLDVNTDRLNFYFYNPLGNGPDSILELLITEDDNSNNVYEYANDDKWSDSIIIHREAGWQLISVPLSDFHDVNPGGNGVFDVGYSGSGSMLFAVGFIFHRTSAWGFEQYHIDMISFSEGSLPTGNTIFDLPAGSSGDYCHLGAVANNLNPEYTFDTISSLFTPAQIRYANWFVTFAKTGTTPTELPGAEVQQMLNDGLVPIITWEMMYESYARLDPVQPRLDMLLNGTFDSYIDNFADKIKNYGSTVIMRIFHEFEGDWYPWSLTENDNDPNKYISAFRYIVDRFRARGANNAKWMWCLNAEPKPYVDYNWMIDAYPGDSYVDIVATDIYNHPDFGVPDWKSFRYTIAETYYYLNKYFPSKPLFVCEVASRERYPGEPGDSQTKAEWICAMSKELKTNFHNVRALVFFSLQKEHDWRLNSSANALEAARSCLWQSSFFTSAEEIAKNEDGMQAYPNPFSEEVTIRLDDLNAGTSIVEVSDVLGHVVARYSAVGNQILVGRGLRAGAYFVTAYSGNQRIVRRIVKI
jgi:hypothetical protein